MPVTMADNTVNTGSVSDEERERAYRKELLKKKDSAKGRKDKGYKMFEEEDSEEEPIIIDDVRSPSKMKKHSKPSFKFAKKEKYFKKDKEEKREKDIKKEEKKKEEKEAKKEKLRIGKDKKKTRSEADDADESVHQIFGVPLAVAVDKSKCHDGIPLPAIFRECIDYVEEFGLICEGIYRISGVKSKVQALKDCYNRNQPGYLHEHEPNVVASLLKLYLRDLPEPVLTKQLTPKFEEASTLKNVKQKVETFQKLIEDLPAANRFLLSWTIVHMTHIIAKEKQNKMSLQNVSIVLSPTLQISHRVLNVLFTYSKILFTDVVIKKYVPPLRPVTSRWSLELPDSPTSLEEELRKQESLLAKLHEELMRVKDADKEEQVWEVQRVVTQLKRKLKLAKKQSESLKKVEQKQDLSSKPENRKQKEQEDTQQQSQQPKQHQHIQIKQPPVAHKQRLSQPFRRQILLPLVPQKVPIATTAAKAEDEEVKEEKTKEIIFRSVEELEEELKQVELETKKEAKNEQSVENVEQEEKETKEPDNEDEVHRTVDDQNEDKNEEIKDEERVTETVMEEAVKEEPEAKPEVEEVVPVQEVEGDKEMQQEVNIPSGEVSDEDTLEIKTPDEEEVPQTVEEQCKSEEHTPEAEISDTNSSMVIDKTDEERASLEEEDEDEEVNEEEVAQLLLQEAGLLLEEEELLAIRHELYKKIETEQNEIERLHQEMADIRSIRDDVYTDSSCSDSSDESGEEWELEDILTNLRQQNGRLERENQELCEKVHQERQICLEVKVQIRMIQQGHLDNAAGMEEEKEGILVQL